MTTMTADTRKERPEPHELQRLYDEGKTNAEIARLFCVAESTVKGWRRNFGLPTRKPRYERTIPWRVKTEHLDEYHRRMLQVLGRRLSGQTSTPARETELNSWLERRRQDGRVVAYARWRTPGFVLVPGQWIDGEIPIQLEEVPSPSEIGGKHRRFETE